LPHEDEVQRQFAGRVGIYDRRSAWILDPGLLAAIVGAYRGGRDARLLDVCCGTGAVGGAFARHVGHRVGVDLTDAMLSQARTRMDEVHQADARHLPFADASFDVVVSRQAMHFFDDPALPIREMGRVLRPGGQLILGQRVPYGEADAAWMAELNALKQPNLRTFILERHLLDAMASAGVGGVTVSDYFLWEDMHDWVASPEVPGPNRGRILEHCRSAPASVRAVHPMEIEGDDIRCRWRWMVAVGTRS